jgi:hypothetical protein
MSFKRGPRPGGSVGDPTVVSWEYPTLAAALGAVPSQDSLRLAKPTQPGVTIDYGDLRPPGALPPGIQPLPKPHWILDNPLYRELNGKAPYPDAAFEQPLFQDTIFPMIGGPVDYRMSTIGTRIKSLRHGFDVAGYASRFPEEVVLDPEHSVGEGTSLHESGHIADYRNTLPELEEIAEGLFPIQKEMYPESYASRDIREYKAELLRNAVKIIRGSETYEEAMIYADWDDDFSTGGVIGLGRVINALLDQPVFRDHPLRIQRDRQRAKLPTPPEHGLSAWR